MAYRDMREFLAHLDSIGQLRNIDLPLEFVSSPTH